MFNLNWEKKTIGEVYYIDDMAEKYQVDALKEEIDETAKIFPLDEENVVIGAFQRHLLWMGIIMVMRELSPLLAIHLC